MSTDPDAVEFDLWFRIPNSTSTKGLGIPVYEVVEETVVAHACFATFIKDVHMQVGPSVLLRNDWKLPGVATMDDLRAAYKENNKPGSPEVPPFDMISWDFLFAPPKGAFLQRNGVLSVLYQVYVHEGSHRNPSGTFRPIREKPHIDNMVISMEMWYMERNGPVEVSRSLDIVAMYRKNSKYVHLPHPSEYEVSASTLATN
eukprot:scaffold31133_cov52-Attheya_sp.AAC.1